ncbi:MAG: hypothetical protein PHH87_03290 [Desulfuromonas sp.]|nr:hypothetical protein [Desulfuromonas sp.]
MKKTLFLVLTCLIAFGTNSIAANKSEKENKLAQDIQKLTIADGIIDVYRDVNGAITVYIGGRGSATESLVKISKLKAEAHALRIAEASANKAFAEFVQKNVDACLDVTDTITDSSMNIDDIMDKMKQVTQNEELAKELLPEDRAIIIQAVLGQVITYIKSSSSVQSVSGLEVRQKTNQMIRGMTIFGSHSGLEYNEMLAVKVFKWSPSSANFAADAETLNNQKAKMHKSVGKSVGQVQGSDQSEAVRRPFISTADDF